MRGRVSINTVLESLKMGHSARITAVKGTGNVHRGELREFNVIHGFAYASFKEKTPIEHVKAKFESHSKKYTKKGTIPLVNLDNEQQLTIIISHIIGYDGLKVIH